MPLRVRIACFVLLSAGSVACSSAPTSEGAVDPGPVGQLFQEHCNECHTAGGIAYPFDTHAQAAAVAPLIRDAVVSRRMPPMNANGDGSCHTFVDAKSLDDEAIATLVEWVDAGAPVEPWAKPTVRAPVDIGATARLQTPAYQVSGTSDDYRCFVVDLEGDETRYLTGFEVLPGAPEVVHHMVLFAPSNETAATLARARDQAQPGDGYTCFGSAGVEADVVATWAPGSPPTTYPEGTGIPIDRRRPLIVQMHYYPRPEARVDTTAIDLALRADVDHPARITLTGDVEMAVAPGHEAVSTATSFQVPGSDQVTVHGVFPHMHRRGQELRLELSRDEGVGCMIDVPRWDFDWQELHRYETPILVEAGDAFDLRCTYDTSSDIDPVYWGDGTDDEMCFAFLYVTEGAFEGAVPLEERVAVAPRDPGAMLGSPPAPVWASRHGGAGWDGIRMMARHDDGDVSAVGWTTAEEQGGDAPPGENATVLHVDAAGTLQWQRTFGGTGDDFLHGVAPAVDGGVYVTGVTGSPTWDLDGISLEALGGTDALIVALDAQGMARWARRFGGAGDDQCRRTAAHPDGGLISLSWHAGPFVLEGESYGASGARTAAVARWSDTGELLWVETLPSPGGSLWEPGVAADGTVHAIGDMIAEGDLAGVRWSRDPDGTTSFVAYPGASWGWFNGLAVDDAGTAYVIANARGPVSYADDPFESGVEARVLRIGADGDESVIASFTGPGATRGRSIGLTDEGNVVVAGSFFGELRHGGQSWRSRGGEDVFVARLDPAGTTWLRTFGGPAHDSYPIVVQGGAQSFLAFESWGTLDLAGTTLAPRGERDIVLVGLE